MSQTPDDIRKQAQQQIRALLEQLSAEEKKLLNLVLRFERANLHYKRPPSVKEELMRAVEEAIR